MINPRLQWAVAAMLVLLVWLASPVPTAAHASLVAAEPPPGARLDEAPANLRLTFSEPLASGSSLVLYRADFTHVAGMVPALNSQVPEELQATLPLLEVGVYTVQWQVVSQDGHTVSGSYQFSVVAPGAAVGPRPRWAFLLLTAALGLGVVLAIRARGANR